MSKCKTKTKKVKSEKKKYIDNHEQKEILKFLNKVDYNSSSDYKKDRNR